MYGCCLFCTMHGNECLGKYISPRFSFSHFILYRFSTILLELVRISVSIAALILYWWPCWARFCFILKVNIDAKSACLTEWRRHN